MKFGIRTPSLKKRFAARTSASRFVRHSLGFKAPRGLGWFTNPHRAAYNRVYNRTTMKADNFVILGFILLLVVVGAIFKGIAGLFTNEVHNDSNALSCPRCNSAMVLRNGRRGQFYGCSQFPRCRGTRDSVPSPLVSTREKSETEKKLD